MSGYVELRSVIRVLYFVALRLLFICMLDSNPRASSIMYTEEFLVIKKTSGLRESPVIKLGDQKMEDRHEASSLKTRNMFLQDREELNYGAKCNGHLQDTIRS